MKSSSERDAVAAAEVSMSVEMPGIRKLSFGLRSALKKGATKSWRMGQLRRQPKNQGLQRVAAGVVSGMPPGNGDASMKFQCALPVIKPGVARSFGPKQRGFASALVSMNRHAGDLRRFFPCVGQRPIRS